ncbi:MAG: hypothetical protein VX777_06575 [Chlamydiota bacterium]|nr:hypothetical protein [Chlamydiota bacterium]
MLNSDAITYEINYGKETIFFAVAVPKGSEITSSEAQTLFEKIIKEKGATVESRNVITDKPIDFFKKTKIPMASNEQDLKEIVSKTLKI